MYAKKPFSGHSQRGVQWVIKSLCQKVGIRKEVTTHTLHLTYATHLLEDGLDIVTIKNLLGHANIETTMIYLHIAKTEIKHPFCPLDLQRAKLHATQV